MDVLFDIDGVLVHPWGFRRLLESKYGISPETTRAFFDTRFNLCTRGEADLFEELPPHLEAWGWPGSLREFVETWFEVENTPNRDVLEFVVKLRAQGHRCHIASTQERHRARFLSEVMGFQHQFDSLFYSYDLGVQKPDLAFFAAIEADLGYGGRRLLFIDDVAENVKAAGSLGWLGVHFTGVQSLDEVTAQLQGAS